MARLYSARLFLVLFSSLFLNVSWLAASHVQGVDLTFECLNACTTRVYLSGYRDCSGVTALSTNLTWTSSCAAPTPLGAWSSPMVVEVPLLCPGVTTQCTNPSASIPGVEQMIFWRDFDICAVPNCTYTVSWSDCCRPNSPTSLNNPGSQGIFLADSYQTLAGCNNSPQFQSQPVFYLCSATAYQLAAGAYDADGDSLAYSLATPLQSSGVNVTYNLGYSPTSPLGPSWNVSIDSQTGVLSVQPQPGGIVVGVVAVEVREYRNGSLIGRYYRDHMISVLSCGANTSPTLGALSLVSGCATLVGDVVTLCGSSPVTLGIGGFDPNGSQTTEMMWDKHLPGLVFYDPANPALQDTFPGDTAEFTFVPGAPGSYSFWIRMRDSHCPVSGVDDRIITFLVPDGIVLSANATQSGCNQVDLAANAQWAQGPVTYTWSGAGGLAGSGASLTFNYPGPGTYAWTCVATDGSTSDTVSGSVTVNNAATLISPAGPLSLCQGNSLLISVAGCPGCTYVWSDAALAPFTYATTPGTYFVSVTDVNGCVQTDSVVVNLQGPTWAPLFSPVNDLVGCPASPVLLSVSGSWGLFSWNNGSTLPTQSVSVPGTYSVTVQDGNACLFYDSVTVNRLGVEVYGWIQDHLGAPLANQRVYTVSPDAFGLLVRRDSTWTNGDGYYEFCTVGDTLVALRAKPDMGAYPDDMPTYADTALFFAQAAPHTQGTGPLERSWATRFGTNPGGNGNIIGWLNQGTMKTQAPGDPMAGVTIWAMDATQNPLGSVMTDSQGKFEFSNLPYGDIRLFTDVSGRDLFFQTPTVNLSVANPKAWAQLWLHSTWVELEILTRDLETGGYGIFPAPNPSPGRFHWEGRVTEGGNAHLRVWDGLGRVVVDWAQPVGAGALILDSPTDLPTGLYLYEIRLNGQVFSGKVIRE